MTSDRSPSLRAQAWRARATRALRAPARAMGALREAGADAKAGLAKLRETAKPRADARTPKERALAVLAAMGAVALLLWRSSRRRTDRYRLLTDVLGAILIVLVVIGLLAAITGGAWPPVLVVESGSMMHSVGDTQYGRIGSIDPGDLVLVRPLKDDRVHTWAENGRESYGRPGDVIVYAPDGNRANISVIHRAMAYVEVKRGEDNQVTYHLYWVDGQILDFGREGIYFPPLGFDEDAGFSPAQGYRPAYSGYITKGDNAFLNPVTDQAGGISAIVDPTWVIGRAQGELPWIGLGKLALQGRTNPAVPGWSRVGNAFAPLELWSCFWIVLALVVFVPLTIDTWRWRARLVRERAREAAILEENRRIREARRKQLEEEAAQRVHLPPPILGALPMPPPALPKRKPAAFTPIVRGPAPAPGPAPGTPAKKRATFLPVAKDAPPKDGAA